MGQCLSITVYKLSQKPPLQIFYKKGILTQPLQIVCVNVCFSVFIDYQWSICAWLTCIILSFSVHLIKNDLSSLFLQVFNVNCWYSSRDNHNGPYTLSLSRWPDTIKHTLKLLNGYERQKNIVQLLTLSIQLLVCNQNCQLHCYFHRLMVQSRQTCNHTQLKSLIKSSVFFFLSPPC